MSFLQRLESARMPIGLLDGAVSSAAQSANNCSVKRCFFRRQLASFRVCKLPFAATSEPFLLTEHLRERDLTVRSQHLLITHAAHFLVRFCVNIRIRCNDMIANILLNSLLQKQFADSISEHTEDGFERFSEDLRQKVSGIFALQIAAVKNPDATAFGFFTYSLFTIHYYFFHCLHRIFWKVISNTIF